MSWGKFKFGRKIAAAAGVAAFAFAVPALAQPFPFYDVDPSELRGKPGTLIRVQPVANPPAGASAAFRIVYRSTGLKGEPIAVSGVVAIPSRPAPPGGRSIVAWAHPTTGVHRKCAPSLRPQVFQWIPGLNDMLARGYVVTATDYPGPGMHGPHPYMVGLSEGRAVLDSVRAARELKEAAASNRFAVWGHSQGGHASLFTGQLARSYAPELRLFGVAAAAPATELAVLFKDEISGIEGKVLASFAVWSWSHVFNIPLDGVVLERSMLVFERVASFCNETPDQDLKIVFAEQPLEREGFLAVDITKTDPWQMLMKQNTPGLQPAGIPVFLAQGTADTVVLPFVTARFMRGLCAAGTPVRFVSVPGGDHSASAIYGAAPAVAWIAERFAGRPAPSDCRGG